MADVGGIFNTLLGGFGSGNQSTQASKTGTTQKVLSQEAMDKLIQDVLSSDQGLASLVTGENVTGGFGSTVKDLLAKKFVIDTAGQLALITAPTNTTEDVNSRTNTKKRPTVLCTELNRQGLLPNELYNAAAAFKHFDKISYITLAGYHAWAVGVAERMKTSPRLSKLILPWALARYEYIVNRNRNIRGFLTIYVGQPICFIIGLFVKRSGNGNVLT